MLRSVVMKTCVAAACGIFILLASCSGSGEFKPSFNQPLQPVMQPGFVYVDQVACNEHRLLQCIACLKITKHGGLLRTAGRR